MTKLIGTYLSICDFNPPQLTGLSRILFKYKCCTGNFFLFRLMTAIFRKTKKYGGTKFARLASININLGNKNTKNMTLTLMGILLIWKREKMLFFFTIYSSLSIYFTCN